MIRFVGVAVRVVPPSLAIRGKRRQGPMGDLHRLPTPHDATVRLLRRSVAEAIARHPDPRVAARWSAMACESIARHPGPPAPTRPTLDLDAAGALSPGAHRALARAAQSWLASYFEDVRVELLAMHREAFALQRRVAELEVALAERAGKGSPETTARTDEPR